MNWRKWNKILHRDFGYFFFFTTIIYALSGIAINHRDDWDPNYRIVANEISVEIPSHKEQITKTEVRDMLSILGSDLKYRSHYFPGKETLKVFIKDGSVTIDLTNGDGIIEQTRRRPVFAPMNYLHYNPVKWWTIFSDIYAGALVLLAVTGLFIIRGKKGITGRGAWITGIGILIPIIFLIVYLY
jgi:uncharacterized protein